METVWGLEYWVLPAYGISLFLLLVYAMGHLHLMWKTRFAVNFEEELIPELPAELPFVTIQLPVYNERYVIERLLKAAGSIDYPRNRFEIQLLDDSTDETTFLADRCIQQLTLRGIQVSHIRRKDRSGFKAGALNYGMRSVRGELIAIFDADFIPRPDFLKRTVGYFRNQEVGVVQTRWEHMNEKATLMTRIEAFFLNLHFGFEQPRRARAGLFLNFNGTCGIWRVSAIIDAGGWKARTLTEDVDLSYRAQLRGWKILYLNDYGTPGELPEEMSGFRTQQYRWMKGGAQNAVLHMKNVLTSSKSASVRWHGAHHLLATSVYLLILTALLLSTPLAILKNRAIGFDYVDFGLPFLVSTGALFWVFHAAQRPRPSGLLSNLRFIGFMILFLVFTMGLSVHNGGAVISGWLGRKSPFIRTPKQGGYHWTFSTYAKRKIEPRNLCELLLLAYLALGLYCGWRRSQFGLFPIQIMACAGLMWTTALSVIHPLQARFNRYNDQTPSTARRSSYD
jgi:cellulose synthase/poly-beta-1,6-N-acetylglucosamine synthase-like glycosyltransferase